MMPTADRFVHVHVYVLVADALVGGAVPVPRRAGPVPGCSDAEVLTLAPVRHLLGRPSERGFLAEVRRDWGHFFPVLPAQSKMSRGTQRSLEEAGAPPHYPGGNTNRPREGTHDQTLDGP